MKTLGLALLLGWIVSPAHAQEVLGFEDAVSETNFAELVRHYSQGVAQRAPWAGFWWDYKGWGIARQTQRDAPSATEKYDFLFALSGEESSTAWEREYHGRRVPGVKDWWGHCNGWAAAALLAPEPRTVMELNGVRFSVADQKALLSEVYMEVATDFLGQRHDLRATVGHATYEDPNPGSFHLAVVNLLGRQRQGFVIDRHTGNEVWNHPVIAYRMEPIRPEDNLGEARSAPGVYRVRVRLTLWMVDDNVEPDSVTPPFDFPEDSEIYPTRYLEYDLWLDAPLRFASSGELLESGDILVLEDPESGELLGGHWRNDDSPRSERHPDFLWIPFESAPSTDYKNPWIDDDAVEKLIRGFSPWEEPRDLNWREKGFAR